MKNFPSDTYELDRETIQRIDRIINYLYDIEYADWCAHGEQDDHIFHDVGDVEEALAGIAATNPELVQPSPSGAAEIETAPEGDT